MLALITLDGERLPSSARQTVVRPHRETDGSNIVIIVLLLLFSMIVVVVVVVVVVVALGHTVVSTSWVILRSPSLVRLGGAITGACYAALSASQHNKRAVTSFLLDVQTGLSHARSAPWPNPVI